MLTYNRLTAEQKELVDRKIAVQMKTQVRVARKVLTNLNPQIKIVNSTVSLFQNTFIRLENDIKIYNDV